jgi:hypothetical protein
MCRRCFSPIIKAKKAPPVLAGESWLVISGVINNYQEMSVSLIQKELALDISAQILI